MTKMQLGAGLAVAVLAFAAAHEVRADGYDYGYGPVYGGYPISSGTTCPNGQCSGSCYSPTYTTTSYPAYSSPTYTTQTCPNGSCGTCGNCRNGSCGLNGSCANGSCGSCANGTCGLRGQCSDGSCSGRCGTCPNGECERGNCSGNCPNGQCTTRYRGTGDSLSRPDSPRYDRPDYGRVDSATYRPAYLGDRPVYSVDRPSYRDYSRDEPVSRRSWRSERRPSNRDSDRESPFYN
jgi:hypothetical protein